MQIERKFFFDDRAFLAPFLSNLSQKVIVSEFFTSFKPEICYQKFGDNYFLLHKKENGEVQKFAVCKDEFKSAKKDKIAKILKFALINGSFKNGKFEVKIYEKELKTLQILRLFFNDEKNALEFNANEFFNGTNFCEISADEKFSPKNLALFGDPRTKFDTQNADKILTKFPFLKFKLPAYLDSYDGVMSILRLIFREILRYKDEFITGFDEESLHKFRICVRKFRSIVKQSNAIFEPNVEQEISKILQIMANSTNQKRDIEIFLKKLVSENAPQALVLKVQSINEELNVKLIAFFKSAEFGALLDTISSFLGDKNRSFAVKNSEKIIKKFAAILLLKECKNLKKSFENLNLNSQISDFHAARIKIKKLRYALEYFAPTFDEKDLQDCIKFSKEFQELFGNLQDIEVWENLIKIYKNSAEKNDEIFAFLDKFSLQISLSKEILKDKILHKKRKFIKILNKNIKFLKIYKEI